MVDINNGCCVRRPQTLGTVWLFIARVLSLILHYPFHPLRVINCVFTNATNYVSVHQHQSCFSCGLSFVLTMANQWRLSWQRLLMSNILNSLSAAAKTNQAAIKSKARAALYYRPHGVNQCGIVTGGERDMAE